MSKNSLFSFIILIGSILFSLSFLFLIDPSYILRYSIYLSFLFGASIMLTVLGFSSLHTADSHYRYIALLGTLSGGAFAVYAFKLPSLVASSRIFNINTHPFLLIVSSTYSFLFTGFFLLSLFLAALFYDKKFSKHILCRYVIGLELLLTTLVSFIHQIHYKNNSTSIYFFIYLARFINSSIGLFIASMILILLLSCSLFILHRKKYFVDNPYSLKVKSIYFLAYLCIFLFATAPFSYPVIHSIFILFHICYLYIMLRFLITSSLIRPYVDKELEVATYKKNYIDLSHDMETYISATSQLKQQVADIDNIYKHLLQIYPDGFFIIHDNLICDTNDTASSMLGTANSATLINTSLFSYIPFKYHNELKKIFHTLSTNSSKIITHEFELVREDATILWVEGSFINFQNENLDLILLSLRDVSYRRQHAKLEQEIEMERLKVEFFSSISHELKTPLNIIYSASYLQKNLLAIEDYSKLPLYNQMISHNCLRLLRLLNNLLDITRIDGNYFACHNVNANIVSIVEAVTESIVPYANRKNITTIFDTLEEDIICTIDPELIERIMLNLLSNAIKYGKENGHIWIDMYCKDNYSYIHVKDDGIGIPSEKLLFIFDRFSRVDTGLIRQAEGAGLGLALVKSLVALQNGSISVTSTLHASTEFIISFPLAKEIDTLFAYETACTLSQDKVTMELSDITSL